jgi:hypothetical protein
LSHPTDQQLNLIIGYRTDLWHMPICSNGALNAILNLWGVILEVAKDSPVKIGTVSSVVTSTITNDGAIGIDNRLYVNIKAYRLKTITIDRTWLGKLMIFA